MIFFVMAIMVPIGETLSFSINDEHKVHIENFAELNSQTSH